MLLDKMQYDIYGGKMLKLTTANKDLDISWLRNHLTIKTSAGAVLFDGVVKAKKDIFEIYDVIIEDVVGKADVTILYRSFSKNFTNPSAAGVSPHTPREAMPGVMTEYMGVQREVFEEMITL